MQKDSAFSQSKDAQLQAICEFNFFPNRYLHESWFKIMQHGDLISKLCRCSRVESRISRYLLNYFGLREQPWCDFSEPLWRMSLWQSSEIRRLILYIGLIIHCRSVQRVIEKQTIQLLRDGLGEDGYQFALTRASFFAPADMQLETSHLVEKHLVKQIHLSGVRWLGAAFSVHPVPLNRRLMLKLPHRWSGSFTHPSGGATSAGLLIEKLITELEWIKPGHEKPDSNNIEQIAPRA